MLSRDKLFLLIFSLYCAGAINCYTYLQPQQYGEGECLDDDWQIHAVGSVWYDTTSCEKLECIFYGGILYTEGYGCSTIGHPKECWMIPGRGENYPYCCPRVECPEGIIW